MRSALHAGHSAGESGVQKKSPPAEQKTQLGGVAGQPSASAPPLRHRKPSRAAASASTQILSSPSDESVAGSAGASTQLGGAGVDTMGETAMVAHTAVGAVPGKEPGVDADSGALQRTVALGSTPAAKHQTAVAPVRRAPGATSPDVTSPGGRAGARQQETHIGQYEIIRKLGEGGMGVVYLARDSRLGRRVAIKVLRTQDPELTRRFIIEARTTARCTHENIVIIHDAGEYHHSPFMVLEYLVGKTLTDYQESDPPSIPHAVEIMVSVVRALVRAHEEGIVHRDLKPDNVFITDSGTVKVLDFGIAKLLKGDPAAVQSLRGGKTARASIMAQVPGNTSNTGIAGTAGYMSPEQWATPGDVDHRADIWAVGCCLFELVTGRNPLIQLGDPLSVAKFLAGPEPMPTALDWGAKIPRQLSEIIDRCLQKERADRFKDARSLLKALEPFLPGRRQDLDGPVDLSPFAGLRAFQEEDAARFFGRSRELGTMLSRLRETPLMATVGPSGVGKSSFLRAGVVPALKASGHDWDVLVVRPGRSPLAVLAEKLRPFIQSYASERGGSVPPSATDEEVVERLAKEPGFLGAVLRHRCRTKQKRLMLLLDQFEELYTLGASNDERRAFTTALLGAADDAVSPVRVMLSIRADFLGRTTEDPDFVDTLSKGLFFLGPPSEEGLREALVRPAEMMGYRFESNGIVDEMIHFLDGTPNGLPLLQFTAAQLWDARDPQNRLLTQQSYVGMGGVEGALVSHADAVYNQLPPELQKLCRTLFMHLVTNERTRAVRTMKELGDLAGNKDALRRLVEQLVESRLWVVTTREGDPTVEIVHESLITSWPSLRRWLDESHEDSVFIDQLMAAAHQWEAKRKDSGLLWRGEMVAELDHFERRYQGQLPVLARAFAAAVRRQEQRAARTKRLFAMGGVAILIGLLMAASVGLYVVNQERHKADSNAQIAEKRLADQIRAEKERRQADAQRQQAEAERQVAVEKTVVLEDKVSESAEELAVKNAELEVALTDAQEQQLEAVKAQKRAEKSEQAAKRATKRAEETSEKLQVLLNKERARAARLNAQIGTLVEEL